MTKKIAIIDYKVGNIKSIVNAVLLFDTQVILTSNHDEIMSSDGIILPGVGSYIHGMSNLKNLSLDKTIYEYANTNKPIMGICLGMQLLMEGSEEFQKTKGLGLSKGQVKKISLQKNLSLPHIGWETVEFNNSALNSDYFFCHSYSAIPNNQDDILATSKYGSQIICAAVKRDNITGFQFHPEKSGNYGLQLIKQFIDDIK